MLYIIKCQDDRLDFPNPTRFRVCFTTCQCHMSHWQKSRLYCELFCFSQAILNSLEYLILTGSCVFERKDRELTGLSLKLRSIKCQNDASDLLDPTRFREIFVFQPVNVTCHIDSSRYHCEFFCFSQVTLNSLACFDSNWNLYFGHKRSE